MQNRKKYIPGYPMLNALFQLNVIDRKNTSMIYHFVKVKFVQGKDFWPRLNLFLARSIILLSCSSGGTLIPFEYGWSYQKNSNACNFVFLHRFIHKKFRLVRGPVFYPVSGFCTSDGPIEKIFMQVNYFWYTGSFGNKIFRMVRGPVFYPVFYPVFILRMVLSKKFLLKRY